MNISAVIFDLDGTVLDNEDEYATSFKNVLESLGAKDIPDFPHVRGIGVKENWPVLLEKYKIKTDKTPEILAHLTQQEYLKQLNTVTLKPGLEEFVGLLREKGIATALATANEYLIVEEVLTKLKLESYFDAVTTAEEVRFSKPDPDLFLVAADKLGYPANECLVIEDSQSGITAAHAAGMHSIGIAGGPEQTKALKDADIVVSGYNEIALKIFGN
jgi:beta-phosphoglucomutase